MQKITAKLCVGLFAITLILGARAQTAAPAPGLNPSLDTNPPPALAPLASELAPLTNDTTLAPITAETAKTEAPKPAAKPKPKKPAVPSYHGKVSAVDKLAMTFTVSGKGKVKDHTFAVTSKTRFLKGSQPTVFAAAAVDETVTVTAKKGKKGKMEAVTVRIGGK